MILHLCFRVRFFFYFIFEEINVEGKAIMIRCFQLRFLVNHTIIISCMITYFTVSALCGSLAYTTVESIGKRY